MAGSRPIPFSSAWAKDFLSILVAIPTIFQCPFLTVHNSVDSTCGYGACVIISPLQRPLYQPSKSQGTPLDLNLGYQPLFVMGSTLSILIDSTLECLLQNLKSYN